VRQTKNRQKGCKMLKKALTTTALAVIGCLSVLNAQNEVLIEDFDREIALKQSNSQHLDELVITISIKTKETLAEGDRALKSLYSNLEFINRVATNESFRDCVVAKEYKKDVLAKQKTAESMLQEKKLTQEQYQKYEQEQNSALNNLNNKISELCKEGE
jgi:predicted ATPase